MERPLDVWDLGGVLVDVDFGRFTRRVLALEAGDARALGRVPSMPAKAALDRGEVSPQQFAQTVLAEAGLAMDVSTFLDCWADIFTVRPAAERWLGATSKTHEQWLLSDTDPVHIARVDRDWPRMATFSRRILSFEAGRIKIDAGAFAPLAEQVAAGREVRFFDDREDNIAAAHAAGVPAFLFTTWDAWTRTHT